MSLMLSVAAATQLCTGCEVSFEVLDTLGASDDPAGVGMIADVLRTGDQGYLVSSEALGGTVIIYDAAGRYERELNRQGDGPGEFRGPPKFALGTGGIVLYERFAPELHLFSGNLDFRQTIRLPGAGGSVRADPATGGWLASYAFGGGGADAGVLLLDQSGDVVRTMKPSAESSSLSGPTGDVVRDADGTIWIASVMGMLEAFDQDLGLLGSLQLELPGMDTWDPSTGPAAPPAMVTDIHLAPDGSGVWVFALAPVISPNELRNQQAAPPAVEQVFDSFVYSVTLDSEGLSLLGTDRFDTLVRPLRDGDLAFDMVDTPGGDRRVRVGRLRFTGPGR